MTGWCQRRLSFRVKGKGFGDFLLRISSASLHALTLLRIMDDGVAAHAMVEAGPLLSREQVEQIWAQLAWIES